MKYAIVIPDGAADLPHRDLDGRTPLQAARIPHMDWIASHGKSGTVRNVPRSLPCGSDVAIMSVMGYNPRQHYSGRAPLEAAAMGLEVGSDTWIFRCNLVTVVDGNMEDHSAGHISSEEAAALVDELNRALAGPNVRFYPGVSYRHIMTCRGDCRELETTPPHDILGEPIAEHLPTGANADLLRTLIARSASILAAHDVNAVRRDLGENPASTIWLWGQGQMPHLPSFRERYGLRAAAITAVDLVRGLAKLVGWDVLEVEGATGFLDTNYEGKGQRACEALDEYDLVVVHVEAPDECGHSANLHGKVESIEKIDRYIVGPLLERLRNEPDGQWRLLVLPDHPTPVSTRSHTYDPVPFAIAGAGMEGLVERTFSEADAEQSDLHIPHGHELMEYLLTIR